MVTREQVFDVVKAQIIETLDDVEVGSIDPDQSMKELGANSLDIVEIVSCSMRELKVKVPRSELSKLTNITQLVDVLVSVSNNGAQSAAAPS